MQNQGNVIIQSRENGQKPQFGQFFDKFRPNKADEPDELDKLFIKKVI